MAGNYSLGEAVLGTDVDLDGLVKGLKEGKKTSEGWVAKIGGHLQTIGKIAMGVGTAIGGAVLAAGIAAGNAIDQAADAIEMMGKFEVVFGDFGTAVADELTNFGDAVGRSKYDLMGMASSVQDLLVPMGLARDEASEMSTVLTELAVDVGSFNNVAEADVLEAFKSALIGNTESVKRFGVIINQTTLDQELMNMGIEKGIEGATEQEKVMARMNMILRATADAQGDAARTADSWANTMRGLKARLKDAVTELGLKLIPVVQPFLNYVSELAGTLLPKLFNVFDTSILPVLERVTETFEAVVRAVEAGANPLQVLSTAVFTLSGGNAELSGRIMKAVNAVKDFVTRVWEFLTPVREWIAESVTLKDVLIGVGVALASVILPLLWSVVSAVAPVIAVFAGVVLAVTLLRKAWEEDFLGIRTTLIDVWENTLKPAFEEVGAYFKDLLPEGGMTFKEFIQEKLLPTLEKIGLFIVQKVIPFLAQVAAWLITRIPPAVNAAIAAFNWVKTAIGNVSGFIRDTLIPTLKNIVTTVGSVVNTALSPFRAAVAAVGAVWQNVLLPALQAVWGFITDYVIPLALAVGNVVSAALGLAVRVVAGVWQNVLLPALQAVWGYISGTFGPIIETLAGIISGIFQSAVETISDIWENTFKPALEGVWEFIEGTFGPIFETLSGIIRDTLGEAIDKGKERFEIFKGGLSGLKRVIDNVIGWLNGLAEALDAIQLPEALEAHSPSPFEVALRGVADALREVDRTRPGLLFSAPDLSPRLAALGSPALAGVGAGGAGGDVLNNYGYLVLQTPGEAGSLADIVAKIRNLGQNA